VCDTVEYTELAVQGQSPGTAQTLQQQQSTLPSSQIKSRRPSSWKQRRNMER